MKFAIVAAAFPITITALLALLRSPFARRIVAAPSQDRWHTTATPVLGGVGIFAGFVAAVGLALAVGAAGGTRLRSALVQVVAGILDEGLGPNEG